MANDSHPEDFIYDNLATEQNIICAAHDVEIERLIFIGATYLSEVRATADEGEHLITGLLEPSSRWSPRLRLQASSCVRPSPAQVKLLYNSFKQDI